MRSSIGRNRVARPFFSLNKTSFNENQNSLESVNLFSKWQFSAKTNVPGLTNA